MLVSPQCGIILLIFVYFLCFEKIRLGILRKEVYLLSFGGCLFDFWGGPPCGCVTTWWEMQRKQAKWEEVRCTVWPWFKTSPSWDIHSKSKASSNLPKVVLLRIHHLLEGSTTSQLCPFYQFLIRHLTSSYQNNVRTYWGTPKPNTNHSSGFPFYK